MLDHWPGCCRRGTRVRLALIRVLAACAGTIGVAFAHQAIALEFQCKIPNDIRFIKVDIPGQQYLCEVSVTYQQSGKRDVKWFARNDTLFCSAKAYELRDKYENLWNYTCATWPDRDGIDLLSPAQRAILDQRLKVLIEEGRNSNPPFRIRSVKAIASTPLDEQPGMLAVQFFTDTGDFTEVIDDIDSEWSVMTTIGAMADQIISDTPVSSALIHAISEEGTLEVHTLLSGEENSGCFGAQVLTPVGSSGVLKARTPHLYVCE